MRNPRTQLACIFATAAVVLVSVVSTSHAAYLTIFGAPAYDQSTLTGYTGGSLISFTVNASGTAVNTTTRQFFGPRGTRAITWNSSSGTELGNLGSNASLITNVEGRAINAAGTVVGLAEKYVSGNFLGTRAVRWDAGNPTAVELANLGTAPNGITAGRAMAINNVGSVVGRMDKYDGSGNFKGTRAVRWDTSGAITELTHLGTNASGSTDGLGVGINGSGTIVGNAKKFVGTSDQGTRPVRWDASGNPTELEVLGTMASGIGSGSANRINSSGVAIGIVSKLDGAGTSLGERAVRWDASGTAATELGVLGTTASGTTQSHAYDVNDAGTITGMATKYVAGVSKGSRAVRWDVGSTTAIELGLLGTDPSGVSTAFGYAINSSGIVVGYARKYDGLGALIGDRATIWGLNGLAVDLNDLIDPASGWTLNQGYAISDTGWVSGLGRFDPDGPGGLSSYDRLFLLQIPASAVPEPTSIVTIAILAGSLALRRPKRAAN